MSSLESVGPIWRGALVKSTAGNILVRVIWWAQGNPQEQDCRPWGRCVFSTAGSTEQFSTGCEHAAAPPLASTQCPRLQTCLLNGSSKLHYTARLPSSLITALTPEVSYEPQGAFH